MHQHSKAEARRESRVEILSRQIVRRATFPGRQCLSPLSNGGLGTPPHELRTHIFWFAWPTASRSRNRIGDKHSPKRASPSCAFYALGPVGVGHLAAFIRTLCIRSLCGGSARRLGAPSHLRDLGSASADSAIDDICRLKPDAAAKLLIPTKELLAKSLLH